MRGFCDPCIKKEASSMKIYTIKQSPIHFLMVIVKSDYLESSCKEIIVYRQNIWNLFLYRS